MLTLMVDDDDDDDDCDHPQGPVGQEEDTMTNPRTDRPRLQLTSHWTCSSQKRTSSHCRLASVSRIICVCVCVCVCV